MRRRGAQNSQGRTSSVGKYVAKRVVLLIIIIFFVSIAAFFLVHLLPGNPTVTILGPNDTTANAAASTTSSVWTSRSDPAVLDLARAMSSRATWASRSPPISRRGPSSSRHSPSTSS